MSKAKISRGEVTKASLLGLVGTFLEAYDLIIGSIAAGLVFPRIFFPREIDPTVAAVYSFTVAILVAFIFRILGAVVFGYVGDKLGRRTALVLTLVLAGVGSLIIGLAPEYAVAGYLGLILVLIGRALVAIGLSGEGAGVITLALEQAYAAGSSRRAFWTAVPYLAWSLASMAGPGTFVILSSIYPENIFYLFGWRVAFYIGATVALIGVFVRLFLLESQVFEDVKRSLGLARQPVSEAFIKHWRPILGIAFINALGSVIYYIGTSYIFIYAIGVGYQYAVVLQSIVISSIIAAFFAMLCAFLSDIFGRKIIILLFTILAILLGLTWPLLVLTKQVLMLFIAQIIGGMVIVGIHAPMQALAAEQFPTRYRYSGTSLGLQIGAIVGPGIATPVITGLIGTFYDKNWWIIPSIGSIYVILSLISLIFLVTETKGERLAH